MTVSAKPSRLLKVTIFHAIFSSYADVEANLLNYLSVPIRHFFVYSLNLTYGISEASKEFELIYSFVASAFFVGSFVGCLMLAHCMDQFGRKGASVYFRSILGMLSALLMMLSYSVSRIELFAIAQFITGVNATFKSVLYIYLTECAPDKSRGWSSTLFGSGGTIVLLFIAPLCLPGVLGGDNNWWILPAICFLLALIHLLAGAFLPESPKHLYIGKSKKSEACSSVNFYHGSEADLRKILEEYKNERRIMHSEKVTLTELFKCHRLRWCLGISLIAAVIPGISLLGLKSQYMEPMIMQFGLDHSMALIFTMLINIASSPLCLLSPIWIERFGRRPMFIILSAFSVAELAFVAFAQMFVNLNHGNRCGGWYVAALALVGMTMGQASINIGLLNMTPILVGELCPYASRSIISQICQLVSTTVMLFTVFIYPSAISAFGAAFFLPLLFGSILMLALMIKFLPETKGRPVEEIFRQLTFGHASDSDALLDRRLHPNNERAYSSISNSSDSDSDGDSSMLNLRV